MKQQSKLKQCKSCGAEIAKSAKTCPQCGARNKRGKVLPVILIILGFVLLASCIGSLSDDSSDENEPKMTKSEFIDSCKEISYKDLKRNPDNYEGENIVVTVRVEQVVDDSDIRAYSGENEEPEWWFDNEYLLRDQRELGDNIIEDDIVKVYGTYLGMETVYRVIGGQDEVPAIAIKYAEIKQ